MTTHWKARLDDFLPVPWDKIKVTLPVVVDYITASGPPECTVLTIQCRRLTFQTGGAHLS